jgi:hypothetical protein
MEVCQADVFEELLHRLPQVKHLKVRPALPFVLQLIFANRSCFVARNSWHPILSNSSKSPRPLAPTNAACPYSLSFLQSIHVMTVIVLQRVSPS